MNHILITIFFLSQYSDKYQKMTQDRGRKFQLDSMDVDETNFVTTASSVTYMYSNLFLLSALSIAAR